MINAKTPDVVKFVNGVCLIILAKSRVHAMWLHG